MFKCFIDVNGLSYRLYVLCLYNKLNYLTDVYKILLIKHPYTFKDYNVSSVCSLILCSELLYHKNH